jgi:uncharacterized glyoxalase superfamily protein PhnB
MDEDQRITPMLSYEDGGAAIEWLCRAFGFEEFMRMADDDGTIGHAELRLEGARIFLATPSPDYQGPSHHAELCESARRWREAPYVIDGLHVRISDVDGHFRQAQAAGATILSEPKDETLRGADLSGRRSRGPPLDVRPTLGCGLGRSAPSCVSPE